MTTHERELTEPIDLCTPDGARLNPDARGWSRRPLHRANLDGGGAGRNKRWDYWAVLAGDLVVSAVYSDIDVLGLADVYWADLSAGVSGGHAIVTAADGSIRLPDVPASVPLVVDRDGLALEIADDDAGTHLRARWTETDGRAGELDVAVALPPDHESLNVVIPWSDEEFNFTSKHQARPATGTLRVGDRHWEIGGAAGDAWGVLDVGRGRRPPDIRWNWGGGAGRPAGPGARARPTGTWSACSSVPSGRPERVSRRTALSSTAACTSSATSCGGTTTGTSRCSRGASAIPAANSTSCCRRASTSTARSRAVPTSAARRIRCSARGRDACGPMRGSTSRSPACRASRRKRASCGDARLRGAQAARARSSAGDRARDRRLGADPGSGADRDGLGPGDGPAQRQPAPPARGARAAQRDLRARRVAGRRAR